MYIIKLWQKSNIIKKTLLQNTYYVYIYKSRRKEGKQTTKCRHAANARREVKFPFPTWKRPLHPKLFSSKFQTLLTLFFFFFHTFFSRIGLGFQIHHGLSGLFSHFPWKKSGRILWQCLGNCAAFKKDDNGLYDHYFFYSDPNLNSPKNSQCGNCKNFMSIIFYVKST